MTFNLDKPLVFFDIESTGGDPVKDRILQIAFVRYEVDGSVKESSYLVNPQYPIKPDAERIHGISVDMVRNEPVFEQLAEEFLACLEGADLGGYNVKRFDIPMLMEEFARVGIDFSMEGRRIVDPLQIFYKMEPRTLKAALKFYCNKQLEGAHDALADTRATADVLLGQIKHYEGVDYEGNDDQVIEQPVQNNVQAIHDFIAETGRVDYVGRFSRNTNGNIIFNFGSNKGEEAYRHPNMLRWILQKDFPLQVKNIAQAILDGRMK